MLRSLFEAARWAASSYNDQPWSYLVATKDDQQNFSKMLSVLMDMNAAWAKDAPVLAISVARQNFKHNGAPNRVALHDVGAANAQLTMEATSRGLLVHQMAGFDQDKAREVFGIPQGWEPVSAMAIGYPGDPQTLPEKLRESEAGSADTQAAQRICHDRPLGAYCSFPFEVIGDRRPHPAMHRTSSFFSIMDTRSCSAGFSPSNSGLPFPSMPLLLAAGALAGTGH